MRTRFCSVMLISLSLVIGCANRSGTAASGGGGANAPAPAGAAQGGRGGAAPAAAPAAITAEQHEAAMKGIAQANGTLQKNLKSNALPDASKDAQQLATLFADVARFWTQAKKTDAVQLAQQARTAATDTAAAATAGDQAKAMTASAGIGATCKQCHSAYREGDAQTGYRIKAGVL